MNDLFVNESCVNGHCPQIVEETIYGTRSSCNVYCGDGFSECKFCYFYKSDECNDCIHKEEVGE